jgi:very-short-patch-repair endonuclease
VLAVPSEGVKDDIELIELARANGNLLTIDTVRRSVSPARWERLLQAGLWIEVTPGHFHHAATPLSFEMQVRAGAGWLGPNAALFGGAALYWLDVEVAEPLVPEFLLPRTRTSVAHRFPLHTSRRWERGDVVNHRGVRTSTGTRAVIDLASITTSASELEHAIDAAVRARRTALPTLHRRLETLSGRGRTGSAMLRELLLDSGGESYLERRFLRLVRAHRLPRPKCQVAIRPRTGRAMRVDFLFEGVVVEVSGRLGHTSDSDRRRDAQRRNALQSQGLVVLEFTTTDVIDNPQDVVATLQPFVSPRTGRRHTSIDGGRSTTSP